MKEKRKTYIGN